MNIPLRLVTLAVCLTAAVSSAAPRARPFKATRLQPLPGDWQADVEALNDIGDVAGASIGIDGHTHPALWPHGSAQPQALSELPGPGEGGVLHLNNRGEAVGVRIDPDQTLHALKWDQAGVQELPLLPGTRGAWVYSINDRGQAVGFSGRHATLWDSQGAHDLGIPSNAYASEAFGINQRGDVLLMAFVDDGSAAGLRVNSILRHRKLVPTNLTGDPSFFLSGISSNGTVVADLQHFFPSLFQSWASHGGNALRLPPLPGDPDSWSVVISGNGKMVGLSGTHGATSHLVAWDGIGVKSLEPRLPTSAALELSRVTAVNNRGQILCLGTDGGQSVGMLLTP